ncbi:MAG: nitrate reductase [bacterium]
MTLLDFARGPGLQWAMIIFTVGVIWRLVGTLFMLRGRDLSKPRSDSQAAGAIRTIFTRMWPKQEFCHHCMTQIIASYLFHIGLFVVVFLFIPHIEFFNSVIGLSWPGIPNDIIMISGAISIAALVVLMFRRLNEPVLRAISNSDDYISWLLTTLPFITGMLAYGHLGARYETLLAWHLLTVELLLVWFPFGKLMHAVLVFPSRAEMGSAYARRGVKI